METTITHDELQVDGAETDVDRGLRSAGGIRWLHWIGALVVGVSVVGLLAARWGEMPRAVQFLVLAGGAVALQTAGDVARHRLRLQATGSALTFLFTALVPLLAWGAAYLELVEAGFGWLSLGLGLGALTWSVRRVLERVLEYRGLIYPASLGVLLFALPVLSHFDGYDHVDRKTFFLAAATGLGLVLRLASRHINRFFFHRDRLAGVDRPTHFLPFALLALTYTAGMSLLSAAGTMFAVPLVFLAVALIDTGEEYFQALVKVTSQVPERWPRRSVGLLASGFALMAVATASAPVDTSLTAMALVTGIASLRLFSWALRYQRVPAYAFALGSALAAYHFSPWLIPESVKRLFWTLVEALGISKGSTAVVSLADLGALAGVLAIGVLLTRRGKLTLPMQHVHTAFLSFQGFVVLLAALPDPAAARTLTPLAVVLLLAGLFLLRRAELVPIFYLSVTHAAVVWITQAPLFRDLGTPEAGVVLAVLNLAWIGAVWALLRRPRAFPPSIPPGGRRTFAGWEVWLAAPPLAATAVVLFGTLLTLPWPGLAAFFVLSSAVTLLLGTMAMQTASFSWASGLGRLARREEVWWSLALTVTLIFPGAGSFCLALALASLELVRGWNSGPEETVAETKLAGWRLQGWIALAVIQSMAAGWLTLGSRVAALALVAAALAERILAEALERRGRHELARSSYPAAWGLAAMGGVLALLNSIDIYGSPWWPILPGFLASLFFGFLARDGYARIFSAVASMGFFAVSLTVTLAHMSHLGDELYWLAPGLALIGLSRLLGQEIGERWSGRLFTVGATCLYAMPILGLFEEITWGWQIVMLLLAIAFGAASFRLRSRSLLTLSTAAAVVDLGFFLLKLGQTAPLLLWAVGIFFGLSLMGCATLLEYRREILLQRIRVWGREIRSWA